MKDTKNSSRTQPFAMRFNKSDNQTILTILVVGTGLVLSKSDVGITKPDSPRTVPTKPLGSDTGIGIGIGFGLEFVARDYLKRGLRRTQSVP
ncbi:MAG: hypothetical protein MUO76_06470 [Anaerolineaceae bacterium]|nr:hypothetical protein [Anaerolineaceae bacterium]